MALRISATWPMSLTISHDPEIDQGVVVGRPRVSVPILAIDFGRSPRVTRRWETAGDTCAKSTRDRGDTSGGRSIDAEAQTPELDCVCREVAFLSPPCLSFGQAVAGRPG